MSDPLQSLLRERTSRTYEATANGVPIVAEELVVSSTSDLRGTHVDHNDDDLQTCGVQISITKPEDDIVEIPRTVDKDNSSSETYEQSKHDDKDTPMCSGSHDSIDPLKSFLGERVKKEAATKHGLASKSQLKDAVQDLPKPSLLRRRPSKSLPRDIGYLSTPEHRAASSSPHPSDRFPRSPRSPRPAGSGGHWHCELCQSPVVPLLGTLARPLMIGQGARHHCRSCGRTVCGGCSVKIQGLRTCRSCNAKTQIYVLPLPHEREKIIFFVRHAKSIWNEAIAAGKRNMLASAFDRDHPLSDFGLEQTHNLCKQVREASRRFLEDDAAQPDEYYNAFLAKRELIHCSPLLRALQTAHLCFPVAEGWGDIRLLKDAREHYRFCTERDCVGMACGKDIVERAVQSGAGLQGLLLRVDCSDCNEKWWSDTPETGEEMDARHRLLLHRLLQEDKQESCIVVTHSNLIRGLLARFGNIGRTNEHDEESTLRRAGSEKLQPCGVIGVRFRYERIEDTFGRQQNMWIAHDAMLMFGSRFEGHH